MILSLPEGAQPEKLNVQMFDVTGTNVFDRVQTTSNISSPSFNVAPGTYYLVVVAHSSIRSATIKSPQDVRFTASDGQKLTDTFCHCSEIVVGEAPIDVACNMRRATACIRIVLTDEDIPISFTRLLITYNGGSANVNPSTLEGITKSNQSELRTRNADDTYEVFTFPYMAEYGILKMTVTAIASDGSTITSRTVKEVPVQRDYVTTLSGSLFTGDGWESTFVFSLEEWKGSFRQDF